MSNLKKGQFFTDVRATILLNFDYPDRRKTFVNKLTKLNIMSREHYCITRNTNRTLKQSRRWKTHSQARKKVVGSTVQYSTVE